MKIRIGTIFGYFYDEFFIFSIGQLSFIVYL